MKYVMFALLLCACASPPRGSDELVASFRVDAAKAGHPDLRRVDVAFGTPAYLPSLNAQALAVCEPGSALTTPKVIIAKHAWDAMTDGSKKALIYHELFHCLLGKLGHDASGLMTERLPNDAEFDKLNLVEELRK